MAETEFQIGGVKVAPGESKTIQLMVARLYDSTEMNIPVRVFRGERSGPVLFVSAAIHGDEINGVEVLRRLMQSRYLRDLRGTLIAVPIVNVFGFNMRSRYLPDRRDLNRSFPGSAKGSLAARLADIFLKEIVSKSTHGIDMHTGAIHRFNVPHVRVDLKNNTAKRLAMAFGADVVLQSPGPDGSLRFATAQKKTPILVYEGGEALRFDEKAIDTGYYGVLRVMGAIGMIPKIKNQKLKRPFLAKSSHWVRAPQSGILKKLVNTQTRVRQGDVLAMVTDPFGENGTQILSPFSGLIIGSTMLPLVNRGDALFHIASVDSKKPERVELYNEDYVETIEYESVVADLKTE
jgi:predicted deacylase